MEKLTKDYRVIHKDGILLFPVDYFKGLGETYPAKGDSYAEFDTEEEAQEYIKVNNLK